MNTTSFKLYDIRGHYPTEVTDNLAFNLGKILTTWKNPKKVVIAGDIRKSTPSLKKYLLDGFGPKVKVFDLGEVPVPEFCFTATTKGFDLGVMITASHLTSDDNGFKFVGKNGLPFDAGEILKLKELVAKAKSEPIVVPTRKVEPLHTTGDYIEALCQASGLKAIHLHLILDTTRSSTSTVIPQLMHKLGAKYSLTKQDHGGNPLLPENRRDLEHVVNSLQADLGIIWDTDGDRAAFVDSTGSFIPMSFVLGLLAAEQVKKNNGGKVAVDVRAGLVVRDLVDQAGGTLEIFPAWHQTLQFAMQEDPKIVFAAENSGHIMYKSFHAIDDGIFAALKFIDFCQTNDLKETLKPLKNRYFELPETNFPCSGEKALDVLDKLANHYRDEGTQVSLVDGLTVFGKDFKFNLRQSATENLLRLNLETNSQTLSNEIFDKLQDLIDA